MGDVSNSFPAHDQCDDPDNQEDKETDLRNSGSGTGDSSEAEHPGDECDDKED